MVWESKVAFCDKLLLNKLDLVSSEEAIRCKVTGLEQPELPCREWRAGCVCGVFGDGDFRDFRFFCLVMIFGVLKKNHDPMGGQEIKSKQQILMVKFEGFPLFI